MFPLVGCSEEVDNASVGRGMVRATGEIYLGLSECCRLIFATAHDTGEAASCIGTS